MEFETGIALITSLMAIVISIINTFISRKKISSEIITKNRVNWISDVRELLKKFLDIYIKNEKKYRINNY